MVESWLSSIHFDEYTTHFVENGYDLPTISRMTPEDLIAIGITNPLHRKAIKHEISGLNVSDGIPKLIPESLYEWLCLLRLEEYFDLLQKQGYDSVDKVSQLMWEDFEEIGIKKLGKDSSEDQQMNYFFDFLPSLKCKRSDYVLLLYLSYKMRLRLTVSYKTDGMGMKIKRDKLGLKELFAVNFPDKSPLTGSPSSKLTLHSYTVLRKFLIVIFIQKNVLFSSCFFHLNNDDDQDIKSVCLLESKDTTTTPLLLAIIMES